MWKKFAPQTCNIIIMWTEQRQTDQHKQTGQWPTDQESYSNTPYTYPTSCVVI